MFNAAVLDRLLTILEATETQDPNNGEVTQAWIALATVYAAKWQLSGKEVERASATQGAETMKFQIRYRPGLHTDMRVECEGVTYAVVRLEEVGRRHRMNIFVQSL